MSKYTGRGGCFNFLLFGVGSLSSGSVRRGRIRGKLQKNSEPKAQAKFVLT